MVETTIVYVKDSLATVFKKQHCFIGKKTEKEKTVETLDSEWVDNQNKDVLLASKFWKKRLNHLQTIKESLTRKLQVFDVQTDAW